MRRPLWFFDLDNTLHDASSDIFPYINDAMTSFVARRLHLDREAASQVRNRYWQQYGATLLGLVKHHAIDPHEFLYETHRFDELSGSHLDDPKFSIHNGFSFDIHVCTSLEKVLHNFVCYQQFFSYHTVGRTSLVLYLLD